jgi:type I restriction enzyme S subunit
LGRIPREWEYVPLEKVARAQGGFAFSSTSSVESGAPWLKIANVGQGKTIWEERSFLPEEFLGSYADFVLSQDDIVVAMTRPVLNDVLKVAKLQKQDVPALLNQRVGRLKRNGAAVTNDFLYALMQARFVAQEIEGLIFGTDPPNVSASQIESITVPQPSNSEQKRITDLLDTHDARIRAEGAHCDKLKSQKKGMMDDLLTGRVRV